ncbi:MAG: helicase-related protein [Bacteroidales bacterium]|nr:helicase-related protein [Bacteroidales bacterium]
MSNFISNLPYKKLEDRIKFLIQHSEELKFLSGFFYFSGLKVLYDELKENKKVTLKILVGLNVDSTIKGLIEYSIFHKSKQEAIDCFYRSVKNFLSDSKYDNEEVIEQIKFFLSLIYENRLIIRKTIEPAHAKLYLFKLDKSQVKNKIFITGSSNLTEYGLTRKNEFNVEISDYGFDDAEKFFDDLWKKAVPITEDENVKLKLIDIIEKESHLKTITPLQAYAFTLKQFLDTYQNKVSSESLKSLMVANGYKIFNYQMDAIGQALNIIDQYNGVVIADVVGLGKTVIACAIAYELRKRGIVIAPPGLIGDKSLNAGWNKYLEDFKLASWGWKAYSCGDLDTIQEVIHKTSDIEVVIIDEAHRFRNQSTISYEKLKNICRNKIVILLTATPFNNNPSDIFAMLKLFLLPKKSPITLNPNLEEKFKDYKRIFEQLSYITKYHNSPDQKKKEKALIYYKELFEADKVDLLLVKKRAKYLAKEIRYVIAPVFIRRNRLDLKNNPKYSTEVKELSLIEKPIEWFYELTKEQIMFYENVIRDYFSYPEEGGKFKGAIYLPYLYFKGIRYKDIFDLDLTEEENFMYYSQFNLYDIMRRLLVKRFESSFAAFYQSICNFIKTHEIILEFINKTNKYLLDRTFIEKVYDKDPEDIEVEIINYFNNLKDNITKFSKQCFDINNFSQKEEFIKDIESDLTLFNKIKEDMENLNLISNDPKLEKVIEKIKSQLDREPQRKIIIFSEYIDTAKYVGEQLEKHFKNEVLTITGNLTQTSIEKIYKNFDASYPTQENVYKILVCTDKLSEGFNLNRAGMVINYDIPWNPVRVIQRVGRINRINKKVFENLYVINFFPTEIGADYVKSREIAQAKMFMIHNTIGEDSRIFDIDEEPTPSGLYKKINTCPDELENESLYTTIYKEYHDLLSKYPELEETINSMPLRVKVAKQHQKSELFIIVKKSNLFCYHFDYDKINANNPEPSFPMFEEILESIKADNTTPSIPLTPIFWKCYQKINNYSDIHPTAYKEKSLQAKALNKLKSLLNCDLDKYYIKFINDLIIDIENYGTLADYTLRKIINFDEKSYQTLKAQIDSLIKEIGYNYLEEQIKKLKEINKTIIIAIENGSS